MRSKISNSFLLLLLLPGFAEMINNEYTIVIPGFPLSLGRSLFIIAGFISITIFGSYGIRTRTFIGLTLVFLGSLTGVLFSNFRQFESFSRTIALFLLLFASLGLSHLWNILYFRRALFVGFIIIFLYWTSITVNHVFSGSKLTSYGELYSYGTVVNHHVVGLIVSVSAIFMALYLFLKSGKLKISGFIVIFMGILVSFLAESRSTTIIPFFVLFIILISSYKVRKLSIILFATFVISVGYILTGFMDQNERTYQRFDVKDLDYQKRTTDYRWAYVDLGIREFIANPLGKGIRDTQVIHKGRTTMIHNQYMTWLLSGGILAAIGIFVWLSAAFRRLIKILYKKQLSMDSFVSASYFSVMIFQITLLTIEWVDLLFFVIVSLSIYLDKQQRVRLRNGV